VHVAVRADAGIAEQVPGAAEIVPPFEDQIGFARAERLEVIAGADPRNAGPDHQHVDMFRCHDAFSFRTDANVNRSAGECDGGLGGPALAG